MRENAIETARFVPLARFPPTGVGKAPNRRFGREAAVLDRRGGRSSSIAAQRSALWMVEVLGQDPFDGVGIVRRDRGDDPPTDIDFERHRFVRSSGVEVPPVLEIAGTPDAPFSADSC